MKWFKWLLRLLLLGIGFGVGFVPPTWWYMSRLIDARFDLGQQPEPSRVYARPLELYPGMPLKRDALLAELAAARYRNDPTAALPGSYVVSRSKAIIHTREFQFDDGAEAAQRIELSLSRNKVSKIVDGNGQSVALKRIDPALIGTLFLNDPNERRPLLLTAMPAFLVAGIQAVEDRDFKSHYGIDTWAIARAMWANLRAGQWVQGGSTLTQQLVKNTLLTPERTLSRKLREAGLAIVIEARFSKGDILQAYLNRAYLGQLGSRPVQGFGAAAEFYFGRELDQLQLSEIALLVGLVKGPSLYDPRRHPQRAMKRRNLVLSQYAETGLIDHNTLLRAQAQPLNVAPKPSAARERHPAFVDLVRDHLAAAYSPELLAKQGLTVLTTLDPWAQRLAEKAVAERLDKLDSAAQLEAAMVLTRASDGEILALVGGRQARMPGFNRAVTARRPVGSLLKPFVYLLALSQPSHFGLGSLISDDPVSHRLPTGDVWKPQNYDKRSHGQVMLIEALSRSYNQAAARLGLSLGMPAFGDLLRNLGVEIGNPPNPSAVLGAVELSPLDVAQLYQALASGGRVLPLSPLRAVINANGDVLSRVPMRAGAATQVEVIKLLTLALVETTVSGTASRLTSDGRMQIASAGKTGTSDDLRDSWYAGYTGEHLGVVWIGRDNNQPSGLTGSSGALRVWEDVFAQLQSKAIRLRFIEPVRWLAYGDATGCKDMRFLPALPPFEPPNARSCMGALTAP